jgi:hypothetical protein
MHFGVGIVPTAMAYPGRILRWQSVTGADHRLATPLFPPRIHQTLRSFIGHTSRLSIGPSVFSLSCRSFLVAPKPKGRWRKHLAFVPAVVAGDFPVDQTGTGHVEFERKQPIKVSGKFADTGDVAGGVPVPTLQNQVLFGR